MKGKLTKEEISKIKELYSKGEVTQVSLIKRFDVSSDTIRYHLFPEYKKKKIKYYRDKYRATPKRLRENKYRKYKEYYKNYMNERYKNDLVFREKQKERARDYYKRNSMKVKPNPTLI